MIGSFRTLKLEVARLLKLLGYRLSFSPRVREDAIREFHKLYFEAAVENKTWASTSWLGVPVRKCPLDLWLYQEIIHRLRPDVIVECGTMMGGSALYLASLCDLLGNGRVVSIDVAERPWLEELPGSFAGERPSHPRITYLSGSSTADDVVDRVKRLIEPRDKVMVILDSDHRKEHVLEELRRYGPLVTPGSYLVVEDTNLNGNPVQPEFGPGPMEAVAEFLAGTDLFLVDRSQEKFLLTFNPSGYLKRIG